MCEVACIKSRERDSRGGDQINPKQFVFPLNLRLV